MSAVMNGVYINGAWRAGHDVLKVINPATGRRRWPRSASAMRAPWPRRSTPPARRLSAGRKAPGVSAAPCCAKRGSRCERTA